MRKVIKLTCGAVCHSQTHSFLPARPLTGYITYFFTVISLGCIDKVNNLDDNDDCHYKVITNFIRDCLV